VLKFANANKLQKIEVLYKSYKKSLQTYIDLIWSRELPLMVNLSSKDLPDVGGISHSQWKQILYKQASEIIRANNKKKKTTKPEIKNIGINIDDRLLDFSSNSIEFDEFVRLKLPFFKEGKCRADTINIPINQHKQSLKYKDCTRKNTIRLTYKNGNYFIWYIYDVPEPAKKEQGSSIAYDCGYKTLLASSTGQLIGRDLEDIYKKLANKKEDLKNTPNY
jgi:hypothetical protein